MNDTHQSNRIISNAQPLEINDVLRRTRALDPECTFEAVAQYVREINDMARELAIVADDDCSEGPVHLVVHPESSRS